MKSCHLTLTSALALSCLISSLLISQAALANDQNRFEFKKTGIALSVYSQKQDYKLNSLSFDNPALAPLAAAKDQVVIKSDVKATTLKLDHQILPNLNVFGSVVKTRGDALLNVFGSVVKTRGDALVKLSNIPLQTGPLPDLTLDVGGTIYHLGGTAIARHKDYFATLSYIHSITKLESSSEDGKANTWIPSIGKKTRLGAFSLGVIYQEAEGGLTGTFDVPQLGGPVKVTVEAENAHKLSYTAGYFVPVAKNTFFRANVEFGDREGMNLELNHRF